MEGPKNPERECDLVMKGGITSGVVYPQAILALKDEYRFRSLGGGSVGAIAAALTAAAEAGRDNRGFEDLETEQEKLAEPGFLLEVFQAPESTRPLLNTLLDVLSVAGEAKGENDDRPGGAGAVLRNLWWILLRNNRATFVMGTLVGVALGAALFFAAAWAFDSPLDEETLDVYALLCGAILGLISGPLWTAAKLVWILVKTVPEKNYYGLCLGSGPPGTSERPLLTDWLSQTFDKLAGVRGPLTFKDLKEKKLSDRPDDPGITLKMLTTNLHHREPYTFPRAHNTFLFKKKEMDEFFPADVVGHMVANAAKTGVKLPEGYHCLPLGDDLPVIVPVRMAISFPILLSAVPLYTVKESAWTRYDPARGLDAERDLQPNLFSDGGICSNFPIHFFDAWLPGHPTFGINLTSMPGRERGAGYSTNDVTKVPASDTRIGSILQRDLDPSEPWLPRPDDPDSRAWSKVDGLVGFFGSILSSAMSYRDNMQTRLPSYQERTVQVPLAAHEGGLNLGMEPEVIARVAERGRKAGAKLSEGFKPARFDHHRWVRLRVLINQLETQLERMGRSRATAVARYLVDEQLRGGYPYPFEERERIERSAAAKEFVGEVEGAISFLQRVPGDRFPSIPGEDPEPALRVTPDV